MKKLILLVGLHKTGTTSIQKTCHMNLNLLTAAGFLYPITQEKLYDRIAVTRTSDNHSKLLVTMFRHNELEILKRRYSFHSTHLYEEFRKTARYSLQRLLETQKSNLVLIGEECSTLTSDELSDLKHYFNNLDFEIQVYCCIRKPSLWLSSMVAQEIIGKRNIRSTIIAMIKYFEASGGVVLPRIRNVMQVFPDTEFYSFDSAVAHIAGPPGYFFEKTEIELGEGLVITKENEGRSDHAVRLNDRINETLGNRTQSQQHDLFYGTLHSRYPALFKIPGRKFTLRENEVTPLLPFLIKENQWLKNQFGEGFYDEEISFSKDPVLLDNETRQFLIDNFKSVEAPIRQIVDRYLAEH